ncbi:MAG: molybdopterin-binding protein [Oscillochloris sp.]|nr:molybdopterin-binding protein [Oscillochloris sp.]
MRLELRSAAAAVGHIVCHNIADQRGRKALAKGRILREADLSLLAELGVAELRVAILEPDDVHENDAAIRLAAAVAGDGVAATTAHVGRVNLRATCAGPLEVNTEALRAINLIDGLTVATLAAHTLVGEGRNLATIKIIPFAVPASDLVQAEVVAREAGIVLRVRPLTLRRIGVVLVSSPAAHQRVAHGVYPAIVARVHELGGEVIARHDVMPKETEVATALQRLRDAGAELVIVAGETSVVDLEDVTPQGVRLAGGQIAHYGAPVEPGNLLLMAYLHHASGGRLPVLGAPGCVRSRDVNIVDLVLPRLMAGEMIGRREIVELGHGGLLS